MSDAPDDAFADAHAALVQARQALDAASSALAEAERRGGLDRRQRVRLTPECRATDIIERLEDMPPDAEVTVQALAVYWKPCHENSVLYYIRTGKLRATKRKRAYRVKVADALAFESVLYRRAE